MDIALDTYKKEYWKFNTRFKHENTFEESEANSIAPTNWHAFLRTDENKT